MWATAQQKPGNVVLGQRDGPGNKERLGSTSPSGRGRKIAILTQQRVWPPGPGIWRLDPKILPAARTVKRRAIFSHRRTLPQTSSRNTSESPQPVTRAESQGSGGEQAGPLPSVGSEFYSPERGTLNHTTPAIEGLCVRGRVGSNGQNSHRITILPPLFVASLHCLNEPAVLVKASFQSFLNACVDCPSSNLVFFGVTLHPLGMGFPAGRSPDGCTEGQAYG